ncbi:putative membrane protein [Rhodopirellula maiorica SM1]|uniref:Putative membrane protein n=1 Tax=Rhodopirellula maiorica SM1 TaxID=1265738 RepID=M5RMY5_9BACT|nr:hypothetical protein [Rhodopirellula maiorica]EMI20688.1 putative membrane protein [Rhodopirellula maiorica SM1]
MLSDFLIDVPVWLALVGWFVGSFARGRSMQDSGGMWETVYRYAWLFGSLMIALHVLASYGVAHGWSHAAAIEAIADESERVTGIRAGWGVYVNFAFATVWIGYSVAMVIRRRRWPGVDQAVFWFTAAIVVSATIVFETGAVRWLSVAGFIGLIISYFWRRKLCD